jgi:alpha-tubulin suppressor-like RCC1 family protein
MKNASPFQRANLLSVCVLALAVLFSHAHFASAVVINQQPLSTNVLAGSNANFTVVAGGQNPISYRWSFNGTNLANGGRIGGATASTLRITNVIASDAGGYRVVVSNVTSVVTSVVATLTVLLLPSITTQPTNQSVPINSNVTFYAAAAGTGPLIYQWQKDGINLTDDGRISGVTNAALTISGIQTNDAGNYLVLVTNAYGAATSSVATLTVLLHPVLLSDPASRAVLVGSDTSFNVGYSPDPSYSFRWQKDGVDLTNSSRVSGAFADTLYIYNVQPGDQGGFRVRVTSAGGITISREATLAVTPVLAWSYNFAGESTVAPAATNVVAIDGGYFYSAALRDDGKLVFWGFNWNNATNPIPCASNVVAISAGGSQLLGLAEDGSVVCGSAGDCADSGAPAEATNLVAVAGGGHHNLGLRADGTVLGWGDNSFGQVNIPAAAANAVGISAGGLHILALLSDRSVVCWGDDSYGQCNLPNPYLNPTNAVVNVVAIAAGGYHSLALRTDGRVVSWGTAPPVPPDATANVIAIAAHYTTSMALRRDGRVVVWGDNSYGQFNVPAQATNAIAIAAGYQHCLALLRQPMVASPPYVGRQPQSRDIILGQSALLYSVARSAARVGYQWYFTNSLLPGQTNSWLAFSGIQPAQAGGYYVVITNAFGATISAIAQIVVKYPPTITASPTNQSILVGSNVSFAVEVTGDGAFSYRWQKNGTNLDDSPTISGSTGPVLTIAPVAATDGGAYRVVVTSPYGTATSSAATLTVLLPPGVTQPPISQPLPAGTNAVFSVIVTGTAPLKYQWRFNGLDLPGRTNLSLVLTNVQTGNDGEYAVVVTNSYGAVTSAVATLTTFPAAPRIFLQPTSFVASVGQNVSFTAGASGTEPLLCQWQKFGIDLPGAAGFTLTLANVNSSFNGSYRAAVSNTVGSVFSTNATLIVSPVWVWGQTNLGKQNAAIPAGATNVVAIAAGASSSALPCLALRADGIVVAWGGGGTVPSNVVDAVAVSSGGPASQRVGNHLALLANGAVVNWSSESQLQLPVPASVTNGNIVAVAAGGAHQLALRDDGTVFAWGSNTSGQTNVPAGTTNVIAIAAGSSHSLALRADGTVVGWGLNTSGQATALSNAVNVIAIAAGGNQSLGLRADGTVVGRIVTNTPGASVNYGPPAGDISNKIAIAAGVYHSVAIGTNRTINGWGATNYGQITIPPYATNVLAIAAGGNDSLALVRDPFAPPIPPRIGRPPLGRALKTGDNAVFNALAVGGLPLHYQWLRDGSSVAGQTNQTLTLTNAHPSEAGDYQLVAMNDFGSATSAVATVTVSIPQPILISSGMVTNGFRFSFTGIAGVIYVVEYKDNLSAGEWTELERRFGVGGLEIVMDTSAHGAMRFYRVRALFAPSPKLVAATWSGGSVNLSFATVAGAQYVVEYTDQLAPPQWHELQTIVGTGSSVGFADPTPAGSQRFYRLRVR